MRWDKESFFRELQQKRGEAACAVARKILGWCDRQGYGVEYGEGDAWGTLKPCVYRGGKTYILFETFTEGFVLVASYLWDDPLFVDDAARQELIRHLNELPLKQRLPVTARYNRPRISLEDLADDEAFASLERVHDWVGERIRA